MDMIKIGRFIAERRKANGLTQLQLAEKLCITDRAVSKWETGKSLPDSSIMLELCQELGITVNDLLSGEVVTVENYDKNAEKALLEMIKEKEKTDKHLLRLEVVIGVLSVFILLAMIFVASFFEMEERLRLVLIAVGSIPFCIGLGYALKIEQTAGYYKCSKCGHTYVPSFKSVLMAQHMGRTRKMKCPECGEKSWQKKVISKD